jgi:hypothetical protein
MNGYSLEKWSTKSEVAINRNEELPALLQSANQLSTREQRQILDGINNKSYDITLNYLWQKTITVLKNQLLTVGISLLAEMLGRADIDAESNPSDFLTERDVIYLSGELGILNQAQTLRLQHTHDMLMLFLSMNSEEHDRESFEDSEAISILTYCIRYVLEPPRVEVAQHFIDFRDALEKESLQVSDERVISLMASPYFFQKLTINILLSMIKKKEGAHLEHTLANINLLLPLLWDKLLDSEKWNVGQAYAEIYNEGKSVAVVGLKTALLKVQGFDFVPETLRSNTFINAAQGIYKAHDGIDNFYHEVTAVKKLASLGTIIPSPAIATCVSALLSVVLGNEYGYSWEAAPEATKLLKKLSEDRWLFYTNNVMHHDVRILRKLQLRKPYSNWVSLVKTLKLESLSPSNKDIASLIQKSESNNHSTVEKISQKLINNYYGNKK